MHEPRPPSSTESPEAAGEQPVKSEGQTVLEKAFARGSGELVETSAAVPERIERTEHSVMEGLPPAKAERIAAMRRELADLQRQLSEAQQRIATELQGRAEDAERLEAIEARLQAHELQAQQDGARSETLVTEVASLQVRLAQASLELDDERAKHRDAAAQLAAQQAASHEAELAALTSERDAARSELAATRAKTRELASHLLRMSHELTGDGAEPAPHVEPTRPSAPVLAATAERPKPPPVPAQVAPRSAPKPVEAVLEVTAESRSGWRLAVMLLAGALLGSAVTIAVGQWTGSSSRAVADDRDTREGAPAAAPVPEPTPEPAVMAAPAPVAAVADASTAPAAPPAPSETPIATGSASPAIAADGVIVLPPEAADHRIYVDGKVVTVKSSRAVVPCGSHELRIGSHGTPRTVDVACGGQTAIPAP